MADAYEWWRNALAGKPGPIHDGDPQLGFYRKRKFKGGPFVGAAIFPDPETGEIIATVDGKATDPDTLWTWVASNPVTEEAYRAWESTGRWPDADPSIGDNMPPADDDIEALRDQIESAKAGAGAYAEIKDDETAKKAQSLRSRLNELARAADKKRAALKQPHLDAGKSIDGEWMPLVKAAKTAADVIAGALSAHETRKARAADEARRKAEEELRKREEEAAKATAEGQPAPAPAPTPEPEPAPTTQIRGGYGKAASVRVVKVATVTDQDAAYRFLKSHKELVELIGKLAQRAVDAGYEVPGVSVEEQRKVA
ncbi:hypothetical protein [Microbaculum marinum]|uniref:Uncharacterized protein n=1 Tax=Microbaculum marinum TaxID=1764581 RepID=A0AAW9RM04_9HYPH